MDCTFKFASLDVSLFDEFIFRHLLNTVDIIHPLSYSNSIHPLQFYSNFSGQFTDDPRYSSRRRFTS